MKSATTTTKTKGARS